PLANPGKKSPTLRCPLPCRRPPRPRKSNAIGRVTSAARDLAGTSACRLTERRNSTKKAMPALSHELPRFFRQIDSSVAHALALAGHPSISLRPRSSIQDQDVRLGETPKPAREARALARQPCFRVNFRARYPV